MYKKKSVNILKAVGFTVWTLWAAMAPVKADNNSNPALDDRPKKTGEWSNLGFYLSVPAYLYSKYSAFGLQAGYEFKKFHLRVDLNLVEEFEHNRDILSYLSTLGIFYSQGPGGLRIYEGITLGVQGGLQDSFEGETIFVNAVAGVDLLAFKNNSFFIEVGSGVGIKRKEGAYNGGTVIGGGLKYFFNSL